MMKPRLTTADIVQYLESLRSTQVALNQDIDELLLSDIVSVGAAVLDKLLLLKEVEMQVIYAIKQLPPEIRADFIQHLVVRQSPLNSI